jgi:hypothetical protein
MGIAGSMPDTSNGPRFPSRHFTISRGHLQFTTVSNGLTKILRLCSPAFCPFIVCREFVSGNGSDLKPCKQGRGHFVGDGPPKGQ